MILGFDAGVDQGPLSLSDCQKLVALRRRFGIFRCVEALGAPDPTFAPNVANAKAAGLVRGAYLVWHPDLDPIAQAEAHFAAAAGVGTELGDLAPALDVELARGRTAAQIQSSLAPYVDRVALRFGRPPLFYTFPYFDKDELSGPGSAFLSATFLWMAAYQATPPAAPPPWSRVHFWQRSGGKSFRTPEGAPCDDDVFLGDEGEFAAMCDPSALVVVPSSIETSAG